ncbi:hypothetical protein [Mycolicibacterium smegmatis]|uniref:Uncharacterized protein n=2 Tax=Mycolicibacterium smegmatis (strain ATCC 700084 / mc(2)155) TaxID=246196 RepID=A0QZ72_MYCS2|nr:hypothetical protein [Mycolicibacterium smegmatis]ABK74837.1 hypothetical protein MSMEG_3922 [Mycolicibacterium smegmatis MC2 155]AFP40289.1 hypothetical protein MSMEI_3831 [Mycolicibacterium smegmatis MC2 155]AIU09037.1 hypothetical protein LJ00_19490 [Mycolicibacterium smegmatis MC2 155]AIU15662.1 hypothetical protein LI99_19495 [Mycolicibacterium smegmatis]AIU22285.1 hypothetical protein LI98_19500 [Mycolicibacterium smegmatis]
MTDRHAEKPPLLRRVWEAIIGEFTPPSTPRPTPSEAEFTEGYLAVGMINDAIEDGPGGDVQGPDKLVISADIPGHGTIYRTRSCPLSMPGSGLKLIGHSIRFRHTTFDPDYSNDIQVTRWPPEVRKALEPVRYEGPGALRARAWGLLAGCNFLVMWAGIALTPILLCGIMFGGDMFTDLPAWFHPGVALASSVGAVPLGLFLVAVCNVHRDAALSRTRSRRSPGHETRSSSSGIADDEPCG